MRIPGSTYYEVTDGWDPRDMQGSEFFTTLTEAQIFAQDRIMTFPCLIVEIYQHTEPSCLWSNIHEPEIITSAAKHIAEQDAYEKANPR